MEETAVVDDEPDYFTDHSRDSITETATDLGLENDLALEITLEFERQFEGAEPSLEFTEACRAAFDDSATLEVRQLTKLLERASYQLVHLSTSVSALNSLTERHDHVGSVVPVWAVLLSTHPEHTLAEHEQCREACILRHTIVRMLMAACSEDSETIDALAHDSCALVRQAARAGNGSERYGRSSLVTRADDELTACGSACDDGFADLAANLVHVHLAIPDLPAAVEHGTRKFGVWHWATQPSPTPAQDYLPSEYEHLRGPIVDQFSVSHGGHGFNSWALNLRLATGNFALAAHTLWGGMITGTPTSTPAWSDICDVAALVADVAEIEWLPRTYRPRDWLLTFSDFRDTEFAPEGSWGLAWIGDGDPPAGLARLTTAKTPYQMLQLLEKIEKATG